VELIVPGAVLPPAPPPYPSTVEVAWVVGVEEGLEELLRGMQPRSDVTVTVCAMTVTIEVSVTVCSVESVVPVASTSLVVAWEDDAPPDGDDGVGRTDPGFPQVFLVLVVAAVVPAVVPMAGAPGSVGPPAVVEGVPASAPVGMVMNREPDAEGVCSEVAGSVTWVGSTTLTLPPGMVRASSSNVGIAEAGGTSEQ